ncbi:MULTISPECIES: hypothetical protein [Pseudomonas]|uniref:hypothetical protein n=1 Tax=Pseudomonas TaxID=286 RepID=UPI0012FA115C|nr:MULTISPECIES: hypothetical protein [Pseudomonas]
MGTLLPIQASDNALNDSAVGFTVKRNGDQWLDYGISEAVTIAAFLFGQHLLGKPHIFTDSSSEGVDYLIWIFPVLNPMISLNCSSSALPALLQWVAVTRRPGC